MDIDQMTLTKKFRCITDDTKPYIQPFVTPNKDAKSILFQYYSKPQENQTVENCYTLFQGNFNYRAKNAQPRQKRPQT